MASQSAGTKRSDTGKVKGSREKTSGIFVAHTSLSMQLKKRKISEAEHGTILVRVQAVPGSRIKLLQ